MDKGSVALASPQTSSIQLAQLIPIDGSLMKGYAFEP